MKKKGKVFRNALIFIILIALTFYILLKKIINIDKKIHL